MISCDNCSCICKEKDISAYTPAEILGGNFPPVVKLCPDCKKIFLDKIKKIHSEGKEVKLNNFKNFING